MGADVKPKQLSLITEPPEVMPPWLFDDYDRIIVAFSGGKDSTACVLLLLGVTDPCLQHAIKKLLVAGGRGGGKDITRDIQDAIDTLLRWQEMRKEETSELESR